MKVNSASARVLQQRHNSKLLRPVAKLITLSFGSSRQDPKKAKKFRQENKQTYRKKRYQPIEHWLRGGPNWSSWKSDHFCHSWGAQTGLLEKLIIFVFCLKLDERNLSFVELWIKGGIQYSMKVFQKNIYCKSQFATNLIFEPNPSFETKSMSSVKYFRPSQKYSASAATQPR